jgi:pimeloyl-ACP methyl ester carboxylesterase
MMEAKNEAPNVHAMYPRLLQFGVSYGDMERMSRQTTDWPSFTNLMQDLAGRWEELGDEASRSGRLQTPREHWRHATDYYHYAQLRTPESLLKEKLRSASRRCYGKLMTVLDQPPIRCDIPFHGTSLPGYLRIAYPGAPCVVLIGGLDSSKEVELHYFAEIFLKRSCSVFYFDGPGQGELLGHVPITGGFEDAVASAITFLTDDSGCRPEEIGCFGVSFGGHLACRAAASDPRISACISIGGFFDSRILERLPPIASAAVRKAFGVSGQSDVSEIAHRITLEPLRGQMKCPLLIVHGTQDHLVDMAQIDAMKDWASGPVETMVLEGSEHVCCDRFHDCLPFMGDWMADLLAQQNRLLVAV